MTLELKNLISKLSPLCATVSSAIERISIKSLKNKLKKRLVTDFSSIADYCRPTPSLLPTVEKTLRTVASWNYLIHADMTDADYIEIQLEDFITQSLDIPFPEDKGPVEVALTLSARTLASCKYRGMWAIINQDY